jgi:hypothetical protein
VTTPTLAVTGVLPRTQATGSPVSKRAAPRAMPLPHLHNNCILHLRARPP